MDIDTIALICAKGASRDIPNKNVKMLGGKPLIVWTMEAAIDSKVCELVYVATDSGEIKELAWNRMGVGVLSLPKSLTADGVYSAEVYRFALRELIAGDLVPKTVIILQPTSPFRTGKHIAEAYALYKGEGTVIAVTRNKKYHWLIYPDGGIEAMDINPEDRQVRQLTPDNSWYLEECGSIYITGVDEFLKTGHYHNRPCIPYFMPEEASLEIDTPYHWWLAEKWLEYRKSKIEEGDVRI